MTRTGIYNLPITLLSYIDLKYGDKPARTFEWLFKKTNTEMFPVDVCPILQKEVIAARQRLRCGEDEYGHNQYMCLPNAEKTTLVEFCYDGPMGIEHKGNCLEASEGQVIPRNCSSFVFGCPDKHFWKYETYKYPACQFINARDNCYMLEPSCLPYWIDQDSNFDNSTENGTLSQTTAIYVQTAAYVSIILPLIFIMMMFAVFCVLLKLKKRTPKNEFPIKDRNMCVESTTYEMEPFIQDNSSNTTNPNSTIPENELQLNDNDSNSIKPHHTEDSCTEQDALQDNGSKRTKLRHREDSCRKKDALQGNQHLKREDPKEMHKIYTRDGESSDDSHSENREANNSTKQCVKRKVVQKTRLSDSG